MPFSRTFQAWKSQHFTSRTFQSLYKLWKQQTADVNISRTITLGFQDFSMVFQDLCLFPGLSRPGNLNILIPGLSRVCTNSENNKQLMCYDVIQKKWVAHTGRLFLVGIFSRIFRSTINRRLASMICFNVQPSRNGRSISAVTSILHTTQQEL